MSVKVYDFIIIGGGIAGLSALNRIKKNNKTVLCLEAQKECGGFVKSWNEKGYTLDYGPTVFLKSYEETFKLVKDIGLEKEIIFNSSEATKRFLCRKKRLVSVPENPFELLKTRLISNFSKLRLFCEPFVGKYNGDGIETIKEFSRRRFGKEISEFVMDAMVSGICAGDISKLEAGALFPRLLEIEKKYRSFLLYLLKYK